MGTLSQEELRQRQCNCPAPICWDVTQLKDMARTRGLDLTEAQTENLLLSYSDRINDQVYDMLSMAITNATIDNQISGEPIKLLPAEQEEEWQIEILPISGRPNTDHQE